VHFIGLENLFHLTVGTYHRPVRERKILLFLDINGSTALSEKLGALSMRSLVGNSFPTCRRRSPIMAATFTFTRATA
jgi:hypothetical protein